MHRFLYMFYDNNEDISLYTKQFKKKLNDGSSNSSCSNNSSNELFNDIIVEYLIDIKQYNKTEYNKKLALELLQQPSQLQDSDTSYVIYLYYHLREYISNL